jgi:teichuronic acid biosynthesis glycosyltransferase TuaG
MSNERQPLVSIITAMYNSEAYIDSTIESVISQTYQLWEMIIVDDCSTDKSAELVLEWAKKDTRIKYYKLEKNFGAPYAARNFATSKAQGQFIAFLDSDDLWLSEKLEKQLAFMTLNDHEISFTAYSKLYEANPEKKKVINVPAEVDFEELLKTNHIGCLTAMYNVIKVGKLSQPGPQYHEDYIMWLKTLQKGYKAYGLNEILAFYRVHNKSISTNKLKMAGVTWNIYRQSIGLSFFKSLRCFLSYAINGFRKV